MTKPTEKANPTAYKPEVDPTKVSLKNETIEKIPQIRVVVKNPGLKPMTITLNNTLKDFQWIVGGYIETIDLAGGVIMICNEDGKRRGLPFNFFFFSDHIVGSVVFTAFDEDGNFVSLNEVQRKYVYALLGY